MKNITETLSGRISIIELSGLSLREIQHDSFRQHFLPTMDYILERQKTTKAPNNIWEIIHKGSYPKLQNKETEWTAFYSNYVKTYIEQDVRELYAEHSLDVFRHFMISAATRTGEVLNYSTIVIEIGKDATTVKNWISILETSGIIYLLEPLSACTHSWGFCRRMCCRFRFGIYNEKFLLDNFLIVLVTILNENGIITVVRTLPRKYQLNTLGKAISKCKKIHLTHLNYSAAPNTSPTVLSKSYINKLLRTSQQQNHNSFLSVL